MNKVLVIGYVWPEPNSSAAGYQMMAILRVYKQQGWQVKFATPAQQTDHMVDLAAEGISSQPIELNSDSFNDYLMQYQPDIVHFDRFMMEEQFGWRVDKFSPDALKILDTVDIQCLRDARHQALKANRDLIQQDLTSDLAKREIAAILRCDIALIISAYEMTLLTERFNVNPDLLHYLPFMVDLAALPVKTKSFDERQHFMTIGNFRHAPNWDAVLYLQSIWPLIRKKLPEAELHIYGSYPPPKATALNNLKTGFLIKGWVEDAYTVIEGARVTLAPLRFGAGLKGKLLDAMVMQTPSVTTSIGAEGMTVPDAPWPGTVANDIEIFAGAAVKLYQDKVAWELARSHTLTHVRKQFNAVVLSRQLVEKIAKVQENLTQHRINNFTGAMLKHHTMASTKYLSQWIMEKNK
ncbi:MAG: glycosyltransferase [Methylophilaceae bacterium]|nr:glycosyltransferase [Methylophilaceae bacterium]